MTFLALKREKLGSFPIFNLFKLSQFCIPSSPSNVIKIKEDENEEYFLEVNKITLQIIPRTSSEIPLILSLIFLIEIRKREQVRKSFTNMSD